MAFTTQIFLFIFFPICIIAYYLVSFMQQHGFISRFLRKIRATDIVLICIGSVFYMWTCFNDLFRFVVYILLVYLLGVLIEKKVSSGLGFVLIHKETGKQRFYSVALPILLIAIIALSLILAHFRYTTLLIRIWNLFFKDSLVAKTIIAPLGISFITFSAISYLADIYLGKAKAGSLIDCMLYLTFFPKVVSGPIILWRDFHEQINKRKLNLTCITTGINRIMIGFAKKLILADTFGSCIASISGSFDIPTAWGIALLYMLQIYYDFSGYSDIAIGLANMLGFSMKENFNFPYLSCSITEFWRRWHISLGVWFREYIYFPRIIK